MWSRYSPSPFHFPSFVLFSVICAGTLLSGVCKSVRRD